MLKFTLKYPTFAPTCLGPPAPSSGSWYWAWLKLHFCRISQYKYIVTSCAVLWQHVFQAVVCVLSAGQLYFYWLILQKCNFSQAQYKLPEDGPGGPKHVGANAGYFNVNFNILYV